MKILIPVIGGFGKSGGFRVLSQLSNYWIDFNHEVYFLVFKGSDKPYYPTKAKIFYYDKDSSISEALDSKYKLPKLGALTLQNVLKKAIEKFDTDIVLANHSLTALPVKKAKINAKKYYYIQAYEPDFFYHRTLKDFIYKTISKKSYKLGLNMIVNAPMYMNYKEINTDMFVFPGLDLENFSPNNIKKTDKIIFGTIARDEAYKGTKYIIEAFIKLRKEYGNRVELLAAFGNENLNEIEGITTTHPDGDINLANYYNSLSAYVCAGTIQLEAVHYPVIESMACKIPVITTGYLPSNNENALIVDIEDSEAIYEAMTIIMENKNSNRIKNGFHDIQDFNWIEVSTKMLNYFIL